MKQIQFAQTYNNEAAHRQVKLLMKQHKQLYIQVNGEAWISSQGVTGIRYQLNAQGWQWILNYLQTGDYEDLEYSRPNYPSYAASSKRMW